MKKGFSLIEVLIVIAIATSVVLVVSNLSGNVSILNGLVSQELQSKSDISQTLQIIAKDIRSASPSASGAYPIDSAATGTFSFYADADNDGINERVRYFLASSSIYRGIIQPTGTPAVYPTSSEAVTDLIDKITVSSSSPLFSYYDDSYTGTQPAMTSTASVANIRLVLVAFYSNAQPAQQSGDQYFSTLVDIRKLRDN